MARTAAHILVALMVSAALCASAQAQRGAAPRPGAAAGASQAGALGGAPGAAALSPGSLTPNPATSLSGHATLGSPSSSYSSSSSSSSSSSDASTSAPARDAPVYVEPTATEVWARTHEYMTSYGSGILVGSSYSSAHVKMAIAQLEAPLPAAPAMLVLLHPQADAADIDRLREAAGGHDAVFLDSTDDIERQLEKALDRFRKRPVLIVGHIGGAYGDSFALEAGGEAVAEIAIERVQALAQKRRIWTFMIGCETARAGAAVATTIRFDTAQVAAALGQAMAAGTQGQMLAAFAAQGVTMAVDANVLTTLGYLEVRVLDTIKTHSARGPVAIYAGAPPPAWPKLYASAGAPKCSAETDSYGELFCKHLRKDVKKHQLTFGKFALYALFAVFGIVTLFGAAASVAGGRR